MQFINARPVFKLYQDNTVSGATLYYNGIFDQSIDSVFKTLDAGGFPTGLRGNFAFVFQNEKRVVGAVDHTPNINLFYTDQHVCHIFLNLDDLTTKQKYAPVVWQRLLFWGGSVGQRTSNPDIMRLEAGTYFEKDLESNNISIHTYIDLHTHHRDPSITVGDIADITEQIIEEQTRKPFNLLWSSGTDSNCILGFIRKLNRTDNCQLISLYSEASITDERPQCKYLEGVYGLEAKYKNLGKYVGITDEIVNRFQSESESEAYKKNFRRTWRGFWFEPNVFQKYTTLYDMGVHTKPTFTGEVGDQIFGSRFGKVLLNYLSHVPNPTNDDIGELFASADAFRFKRAATIQYPCWIKSLENHANRNAGWNEAKSWLSQKWKEIDTDEDIINKTELLQYLYKGSHRVFNYGQLIDCDFRHPFTDYRLFHTVFKTPGHWKITNGKTRRLSLNIINDFVDSGPWTWAKSGIQLSMQQVYKPVK